MGPQFAKGNRVVIDSDDPQPTARGAVKEVP